LKGLQALSRLAGRNGIRFVLIVCLAVFPKAQQARAQEAPPQSVAAVTNSARQREKSTTPARVFSNEDVDPAVGDAPVANDQQLREFLDRTYRRPLTPQLAKAFEQDARAMNARYYFTLEAAFVAETRGSLREYSDVFFPGRTEWEDQLHAVFNNLLEERKKLLDAIISIEDANRELIDGGGSSPEASARLEEVRQQFISARMPELRSERRLGDVQRDGYERAKAYQFDPQAATAAYRRGRIPVAEKSVGSAMIALVGAEQEYYKTYARYTCNLKDLLSGPKNGFNSAGLLSLKIIAYQNYDYDLILQGCDASHGQHYQALASGPSLDGTQGRNFCSDDSRTVRMGVDSKVDSCLSRGQPWHPEEKNP
jgi:hypothetical protein